MKRMRRGLLRLGIGIALTVLVGGLALFPPHRALTPTGGYRTATARYTYRDPLRIETFNARGEHRRVHASFWFPENAQEGGTFPLVVFSHGGLGIETSNESLYLELASQGYVVCAVGHPYHAFWTRDEAGGLTFVSPEYFRELQQEDAKLDKQQSFRDYQRWMETRTGDLNLVIDTILAKAADRTEGVYRLVDVQRIGVMGHSLGGAAALAVGRQRQDVDAVIALEAPFLYDITGVENGRFLWLEEAYPIPVLNIYSDSSWDHLSEWPQYARNAALLAEAPESAPSLHLTGGGHLSLTDLPLASPLLARMLEGGDAAQDSEAYLRSMQKASLDFFNHYLKGRDG